MNCEIPDVQAGFRKGRGARDQIANIYWIILTSNTEEAEVERFYEDLQDLLELTPNKDVLFWTGMQK